MTDVYPGPGHTFGPGYDAKASVALCMQEAVNSVKSWSGKTMPTDELAANIQNAQMWVMSAQVHATNLVALTLEARLALPAKKTCRCRP